MKKYIILAAIIFVNLLCVPAAHGQMYELSEHLSLVPVGAMYYSWDSAGLSEVPYEDTEWMLHQEQYTKGYTLIPRGGRALPFYITSEIDGRGIGGRKIIFGSIQDENPRTGYGFSDDDGNVIIEPKYDFVFPFYDDLTRVGVWNGEKDSYGHKIYNWGFIDKQGNEVIPLEYEFVWVFSEGLAAAKKDGKYGFIDKQGNVAIPFIYNTASNFEHGLAYADWNYIDKTGQVVIDCAGYSVLYPRYSRHDFNSRNKKDDFSAERFILKDSKTSLVGCYNAKGEVVIPFEYEDIQPFVEGYTGVKQDGKWGIADTNGNITVPVQCDSVTLFNGEFAAVLQNGKHGIVYKSGAEVVPVIYDAVYKPSFGLACVKLDGKYGMADISSNIIVPIVHPKRLDFNGKNVVMQDVYHDSLWSLNIETPDGELAYTKGLYSLIGLDVFINGTSFLSIYRGNNRTDYMLVDDKFDTMLYNVSTMTKLSNGSNMVSGELSETLTGTPAEDRISGIFLVVDKRIIPITLNGKYIKTNPNPIIVEGRTLVPLRAVTEAMGCAVEWYAESQTVVIQKGEIIIEMAIGGSSLKVTNKGAEKTMELDVAPQIYSDRTMLPIRVIAEQLGYSVDWDGVLNTVRVETNEY